MLYVPRISSGSNNIAQCVAMNRSIINVLFGGIGTVAPSEVAQIEGTVTKTNIEDTVEALANSESVILVSVNQ